MSAHVGERVRVYWMDEDEWFAGTVQAFDDEQGYYVLYDDMTSEEERDGSEGGGNGEKEEEGEEIGTRQNTDNVPRMMEPPPSPGDGYDDDAEYGNDDERDLPAISARGAEEEVKATTVAQEDTEEEEDANSGRDHRHDEEDAEVTNSDEDEDKDEQSIAISEVPITFDKRHANQTTAATRTPSNSSSSSSKSTPLPASHSGIQLPARGTLRGKITPPRAFVKIAFVEAGDNVHLSSLMLRCKRVLATTSAAPASNHPVWNTHRLGEEDTFDGEEHLHDEEEIDGGFQMQLVPPCTFPNDPPAWLQLRGDVLFSVYAADSDDMTNGRRPVHDFIGQAVLSIRDILHEVLYVAPCIARQLRLQSRQGKPLQANDGNNDIGPEILVSFEFTPTYEDDRRTSATSKKMSRSALRSAPLTISAASKKPPRSRVSSESHHQAKLTTKAQAKHTSSSCINRRKFEKQVDQQNVAFAKRLEDNERRRLRHAEHAKAQAKSRQPIPLHGTMKLDHKASSGINRSKFQQQIDSENKAMDKRRQGFLAKRETGEAKPSRRQGTAERRNREYDALAVGFDDVDKDKVLARDKRQVKLREHDFLMQKAQAKYQQQSEIVEHVMALQRELAELKDKVNATKARATHPDILSKKDAHLRDCLRSAAAHAHKADTPSRVTKQPKHKIKDKANNNTSALAEDNSDTIARKRKEYELLKQEAASLDADKQTWSNMLQTCNKSEQTLDDEIQKLNAQLRFVHAKQAFAKRMKDTSSNTASKGFAQREVASRKQYMEFSREEEEQWTLYQVQQELTQLQIAVQVLKERSSPERNRSSTAGKASSSTGSAACAYLEKKIAKQTLKLEQLRAESTQQERNYEALMVSGEYETLRKQVYELQHTLFLCQQQTKHVHLAQRHAKFAQQKLHMEFQRQVFQEQSETEILFKKTK
ncbi:hypothetical protein FI667_g3441, partial [Globisporangium splendens]